MNRKAARRPTPTRKHQVEEDRQARTRRLQAGSRPLPESEVRAAVACDVCGRETDRSDALSEDLEGEVAFYCGEACRSQRNAVAIDRGPEQIDDR